jgi:hypothetical protein
VGDGGLFQTPFLSPAPSLPRLSWGRCRGSSLPGQVINGRVGQLVDVVSQGQLQPTGELLDPESRAGPGRALAEIRVTDDLSAYHLPGGAVAQVAVYSDHWHELALLRKILLRMKSWQNYIFLEGH